jgi:hypothetical protein
MKRAESSRKSQSRLMKNPGMLHFRMQNKKLLDKIRMNLFHACKAAHLQIVRAR